MRGRFNQRGTSLAEILVSLLCTAIIAGGVCQFCRALLFGLRTVEVSSTGRDAAHSAVQLISNDLRNARYTPGGPLYSAIRLARADAVEIACDLNGDGDTNDASEDIAYSFQAATRALMRASGSGSRQPMLDGLAAGGLKLTYLDSQGNVLAAGAGGLSASDRARIRRIDIVVEMELPHPDPAFSQPIRATSTATVCVRNG